MENVGTVNDESKKVGGGKKQSHFRVLQSQRPRWVNWWIDRLSGRLIETLHRTRTGDSQPGGRWQAGPPPHPLTPSSLGRGDTLMWFGARSFCQRVGRRPSACCRC